MSINLRARLPQRAAVLLAFSVLLGACDDPPPPSPDHAGEERARILAEQAEGRAAAEREATRAHERAAGDEAARRAATLPAPEPTADPLAGQALHDVVRLDPGFRPDPMVLGGVAEGTRPASVVEEGCRGFLGVLPDFVIMTERDFVNLRILVRSLADTTLVVERPDGTIACEDDVENRDPVVAGPMPMGLVRVWVGTYEAGVRSAFSLGLSELPSTVPSRLPVPPR